MAKKKTSRKKTTTRKGQAAPRTAKGKHLVIVESPAKAKTINRYLGDDYVVLASIGHVRDLPPRAPKGEKQPVPGVDLEHDFEPTYEVLKGSQKTVSQLKRLADTADDVWFATDLDREGEAIAWHLAEELGVSPARAKRVVFNAITQSAIQKAFENPGTIDMDRVNAQQARRILDRIVGYQVSPLLWKKVASGLSAGRVQSVAVRLIVDREREIRAFVPDEDWKVALRLALDPAQAPGLVDAWSAFAAPDAEGKGPTVKARNAWLAEHDAFEAELVELGGAAFSLGRTADYETPLDDRVRAVAEAVGLATVDLEVTEDPDAKGPARRRTAVSGTVDPAARYAVKSIETKRTTTRPPAPYITSTMQMSASSILGFGARRTMGAAQRLYEGVTLKGRGQIGLITYMRTDSTNLSGEALSMARSYIGERFGADYLPEKPNFFGKKKVEGAQEAHEAIRPTDVSIHPDEVRDAKGIGEDEKRLYRMIWQRFVACQMTSAQWDSTTMLLERRDRDTGAVVRVSGRTLVFDGFYRATGVPTASDAQTLPELGQGDATAPFSIEPRQTFSSPPARYTEAGLVKKLEEEGIGRPSTYASIIQVIQDRSYVELVGRSFHATDLGEVVTDKLLEGFPQLMDVGYTRRMEGELDKIAEQHLDWVAMLREFYGPFRSALDGALESMTHAKAETTPAPYACPECGRRTCYRFGKNGRFLSCSGYPDCKYAAPVDREGRPVLEERVDIKGPDGQPMVLRSGRFGKFIAPATYSRETADELKRFIVNLDKKGGIKYPAQPPVKTDLECEKCGEPLNVRRGKRGPWLGCSAFPKCRGRGKWTELDEKTQKALEDALDQVDRDHPPFIPHRISNGEAIPEGTIASSLSLPGEAVTLPIHEDAEREQAEAGQRSSAA